jgi:hypothetical protein
MPYSSLTEAEPEKPRYLRGTHGGVSPFGKKADIRYWTKLEKARLIVDIERIVMTVCAKHGISWVQVYGRNRGKVRDACRVEVIQTVCKELDIAPQIVARVFSCHRETVMQALRGKRRKPNMPMP